MMQWYFQISRLAAWYSSQAKTDLVIVRKNGRMRGISLTVQLLSIEAAKRLTEAKYIMINQKIKESITNYSDELTALRRQIT